MFTTPATAVLAVIRPDGTVTRAAYNGGNLVVGETDANGNTTEFTYDEIWRKLTETLPDPDGPSKPLLAAATKYAYDDANDQQFVTDALGADKNDTAHTTTYTFNKVGQQIKVEQPDPDGNGPLGRPITYSGYDFNGNLDLRNRCQGERLR